MARHRIRTTLWRDYKLEWPTPLVQYGTSGRRRMALSTGIPSVRYTTYCMARFV